MPRGVDSSSREHHVQHLARLLPKCSPHIDEVAASLENRSDLEGAGYIHEIVYDVMQPVVHFSFSHQLFRDVTLIF